MLKNHVNGSHGNHAFFHSVNKFFFKDIFFCISGAPVLNDLAPMKNCPGGCKVCQISFPGTMEVCSGVKKSMTKTFKTAEGKCLNDLNIYKTRQV